MESTLYLGVFLTQAAEAFSAQAAKLSPEERVEVVEVVERILDSPDQPNATLDALWANPTRAQFRAAA